VIDASRDLERIRDYVAGRLSDPEHRAFEDRLARDPELVRELELSQRLREGFERLRERGELQGAGTRPSPRRWAWGLALAATLSAVATLLWMQPIGRSGVGLMASIGSVARPAATYTLMVVRGPSSTPVLDLPPRGLIEIRVSRPPQAGSGGYRLVLEQSGTTGSRTPVGTLAGLQPATDGFVHVYADAARLAPGDYEVRLENVGALDTRSETFPFTLRGSVR
jgi:hypothetical protein